MIFLRTMLGVVLVACLVALAGLGYRLWEVERQLAARVQALEQQLVATQADLEAIRASCDLLAALASEKEGETAEVGSETE